jgi:enamine deaminase RidA (YjgF/YER057c/UK114 family)
MSAATVADRLQAAGFALPAPMGPAANYTPHVAAPHGRGWIVHVAGQGPYRDGRLCHLGRVGPDGDGELDLARACDSARLVVLNVLAQAQAAGRALPGAPTLERARCLRLGIFVYCSAGYGQLDRIADAASALVIVAMGEAGRHARSVAGMGALPMRTSVEIDGLFLFE